jgi:hypothetical protein
VVKPTNSRELTPVALSTGSGGGMKFPSRREVSTAIAHDITTFPPAERSPAFPDARVPPEGVAHAVGANTRIGSYFCHVRLPA